MRLLRVEDVDLDLSDIRFRRAKGGTTLEVALHSETRARVTRCLERGRPALLAGALDDPGTSSFPPITSAVPGTFTVKSLRLMLHRRYHAGGGSLPSFGSHRIRHATVTLLGVMLRPRGRERDRQAGDGLDLESWS